MGVLLNTRAFVAIFAVGERGTSGTMGIFRSQSVDQSHLPTRAFRVVVP